MKIFIALLLIVILAIIVAVLAVKRDNADTEKKNLYMSIMAAIVFFGSFIAAMLLR